MAHMTQFRARNCLLGVIKFNFNILTYYSQKYEKLQWRLWGKLDNASNITITQCQKNFADCVMVRFELLNCDLCCFISTTTMSPLHCSLYKLNSFFT